MTMDDNSKNINYPIFLAGQDDWMLTVVSESDLNYHVEPNDVAPGLPEYHGWDFRGDPVSLYLEADRVFAKYTSEGTHLDSLIAAIMTYVTKFGGNPPEAPSEIKADPAALFKWADALVETHYQESRLIGRFRRWITKSMYSD